MAELIATYDEAEFLNNFRCLSDADKVRVQRGMRAVVRGELHISAEQAQGMSRDQIVALLDSLPQDQATVSGKRGVA